MYDLWKLINKLISEHSLTKAQWVYLFANRENIDLKYLCSAAESETLNTFGHLIFLRGLIEFTNYCNRDCYYCGIRKSNLNIERYRLSAEQIFECCNKGRELGLMTFVLQGGEDRGISDDHIARIISAIKECHPDCAVTVSAGERSRAAYKMWFDAGADRYLLRHETANREHYAFLHPPRMKFENRSECLYTLKDIGYQVGAGIMVGSPGQSSETLADDMLFMSELDPDMVGMGPFMPHKDTKFAEKSAGSVRDTIICTALVRLMLPKTLIPATTALGVADSEGIEKGILAGANVIMPNITPSSEKSKYRIYDKKEESRSGTEEYIDELEQRLAAISRKIAVSRGDFPGYVP